MSQVSDRRRHLNPNTIAGAEYRTAYNRGWKAGLNTGSFTLDRADTRGEPDAWYDGYYDQAAGREKWHLPNCAAHGPADAGGCGEA